MSVWIMKFIFYAALSVSFVLLVAAPDLAALFNPSSTSSNIDKDKYYVQDENYRSEQKICTDNSQCTCYVGRTWVGTPVMCVRCPEESDCGTTFMADGEHCRHCLRQCYDGSCECILDCKQRCVLPDNPVTRIAIGCGVLFLATAILAFFFKVFLVCCFTSFSGRSFRHHDDDAASLSSVDQIVAQRLRDAPPRYDSLVAPNPGEPRSQHALSPMDKPPPYHPVLDREELCLQVATLPDAPPPYSFVSYLNASPPQAPIPTVPVPFSSTPLVYPPPANPRPADSPPANSPPLIPLEPGRDLCRTFTL